MRDPSPGIIRIASGVSPSNRFEDVVIWETLLVNALLNMMNLVLPMGKSETGVSLDSEAIGVEVAGSRILKVMAETGIIVSLFAMLD